MQDFIYYFWIFVIGSILGVIIEMIWCFIRYHKIESRKGLIYGPFNPLYGIATVFLSMYINFSYDKGFNKIFLGGVAIASLIEYFCSYFQEKIFGTVSWDYKDFKLNINGRINFVYSLIWGFLTVVWADVFMPLLNNFIPFFFSKERFTFFFLIFILLDCFVSLVACIRRKQRKENVEAQTKIAQKIDIIYNDEYMDYVYPNSMFVEKDQN